MPTARDSSRIRKARSAADCAARSMSPVACACSMSWSISTRRRRYASLARASRIACPVARNTNGSCNAAIPLVAKSGINDTFRQQVHELLQPGKAAVVIMAEKITEDKFADRMAPHGGTLLKTSLSEADERELAHDLSATTGDASTAS